MQPKTKNYLILTIILSLASIFLITTINDQNKIVGSVISEIQLSACAYAEEGGTCFTRLPLLELITPEECCQETGNCCGSPNPTDPGISITVPSDRDDVRVIKRFEEKTELLGILESLDLPEEYEILYGPFNIECDFQIDIVTNIPLEYKDVKILSCKGEDCYTTVIEKTIKTYSGDIIIDKTTETEELEPKLTILKSEEISLDINSIQDLIQRGGVQFQGENLEELIKTLPEKEELEIIEGPFTFKKDEIKGGIKLPFINTQGAAIGLFAKKDNKWIAVDGKLDKEAILADIETLSEFITEDDDISLAIMGIKISPSDVSLERIYNPEFSSRDAVILVHGLATTKETFKFLIRDFTQTKQPFQMWTFSYSSTRYMDEIAEDLSDAIEENIDKFDRIFIVAHSMGGIVAQQALYIADQKHYSYIDKVKKAILIGTPNEGSIVAEAYESLFSTLVQKSVGIHNIFKINDKFINDLISGRITPRVSGIGYYVIAGTRSYTEGPIGLISKKVPSGIKFDGVVSTKSAQNIGGEYVSDMCKNYWEVDMTHMELVDDPVSRHIIGKVIYDEISKTKESLLGKDKYYKFKVESCSPDIQYIAIGRATKLLREEIITCKCGDGYCGIDEDKYSCPTDCAEFFTEKIIKTPLWPFIVIIIILAVLFIREKLKKSKKQKQNFKK